MQELVHNALKSYIRHFPVSKGKQRVLSLLWKPCSFGSYNRQVTLRQANVKMSCDIRRLIQRQLYFFGAYEEENCAYWMKLATKAQIVFDVGANVGVYSLLAAATNSRTQVHSFEPTPDVFEALTRNIQLNQIQNVTTNRVGVGKESGQAFLRRCEGDDGSNEGMNFVAPTAQEGSDAGVKIVTLDEYCDQRQIKRIDLMKIDIEGGEHDALLGAARLLKEKAISCIFLELAEWTAQRSGHSTSQIKRLLDNAGYQIYRIEAAKLVKIEVEGVTEAANAIAFAEQPQFLPAQR